MRIGQTLRVPLVAIVTVPVVAALILTGTRTALAAAPNSSCMAQEASAVSPPGSSDEFPGGMPDIKTFITQAFPGTPPGAIFSTIAKLHEGSHEACDAALE
jgi:hypothetical protein